MSDEHRNQDDYGPRETKAARKVMIELGELLAPFKDALVLVGGWVPELMPKEPGVEAHVGSIDVDLAVEAERLGGGRYAALIRTLLDTGRYWPAEDPFALFTIVDLGDGGAAVHVNVDFLKPVGADLGVAPSPSLVEIKPLDVEGCEMAFDQTELPAIPEPTADSAQASVRLRVVPIAGFIVMKSHALSRDKPKDAYDICYCLQHYPGGMGELAGFWRAKRGVSAVEDAIKILGLEFDSPHANGPRQVVEFNGSSGREEREVQARRAYEQVQKFLSLL